MNELLSNENIEVIFLGGVLNRKELFVTGYLTSLCIKELHAQKLFLGVRALNPHHGLMLDDINELDIYRSFMNAAKEKIVVADNSKFDQTGTIVLASVSQIDTVITDDKTPLIHIQGLRQQGINVIISKKEE
jgi:DeoR/GlpR family transcriptional regulator of sugar metabolism